MSGSEIAVVGGVGPGLGTALIRRFAAEGSRVAAIARNELRLRERLDHQDLRDVVSYGCHLSDAAGVLAVFERLRNELGPPRLVVFNAGTFSPGGILEIDPAEFERCWRVGCMAGFLVGQAAARAMLPERRGTILFTGATAALRGSAGFAALAVPKFGLRALAQSMARELGPKGIHVAHIVIDGGIGEASGLLSAETDAEDASLHADAIAGAYWCLHRQHRSAWTHELDLRPWVERF